MIAMSGTRSYLGIVHDNIVTGRIDNVRLIKVVNARAHVALEAENVPQRQRRHVVGRRVGGWRSIRGIGETTTTQKGTEDKQAARTD